MTAIYLYGHLGRRFGRRFGHRWNLDVSSPAEAVRAIMANRPHFQPYAASLGLTVAGAGGPTTLTVAGLVVGGVSQLLAGTPKAPVISEKEENRPSFLFGGMVNTTAQ